jgi:RimJ/RimL family protein N-acetyltransferase
MITLRKALQSDLDYVRDNPLYPENTKHFMGLNLQGWAKTALFEDKIMGIGGVIMHWPGVGEGWFALSKHAGEYKQAMVLCVIEVMDAAIAELKLHRLEAIVRVDFTECEKLLKKCGFVCEGRMRQYTQDKIDAYLYVLII